MQECVITFLIIYFSSNVFFCLAKIKGTTDKNVAHLTSFNHAGFFPNTFAYSFFSPKIQFVFCLLSSMAPWGDPMVDTKGKIHRKRINFITQFKSSYYRLPVAEKSLGKCLITK